MKEHNARSRAFSAFAIALLAYTLVSLPIAEAGCSGTNDVTCTCANNCPSACCSTTNNCEGDYATCSKKTCSTANFATETSCKNCGCTWTNPTTTTTAPPTCTCESWTNQGCGGNDCAETKMYQTRTCNPSGCKTQAQCVSSASCQATTTTTTLPACSSTSCGSAVTQNCKCGTATCYVSNPDYCCASANTCNSYKSACESACGVTTTTTTTTTLPSTTTTTTLAPFTTCDYECSYYTSWMCVGPVDLGCDIYPSKIGTSSCYYDCVEKGSAGQFSDCESTDICMCYRVEQCEYGDACMDTYGCIPEATSRCQSFSERFKCGDNTCPYQPIINQACCPWSKETDGTIGDCYAGGYASCILDTPSPETICSGGDDEDCDQRIDCADPDCAGAVNCPTTCAAYQPCAVDCAVGSVCAATYATTSSCYYGLSSCCSCSESGVCGDCDLGYGHCSYSLVDNMKETSCTQSCEKVGEINTLKTPKLVGGVYVNVCDKDSGWLCDYDSAAVECCNDADCQAAGVYCRPPVSAIDYGNRYAKCDLTSHTCTVCDKCTSSTTDCASGYCCTEDTPGPKDGSGKCVGPATSKYSTTWLCAQ